MSVTREQNLGELDLDLLEEVASGLGFYARRNSYARMWSKNTTEKQDLVINCGSRDIGFRSTDEGVEVSLDHFEGEQYSNIMGTYFERLAEEKGRGYYDVVDKVKNGKKLTLTLRRNR